MKNVTVPKYLKMESLGLFQLKGKQQEVELFSVYMSQKKQEEKKIGRKGFFRRKPGVD